MKAEIQKILNLTKFFNVVQATENSVKYTLEKPSRILIENIHANWLRSLNTKTHKHMPVFLNQQLAEISKEEIPFGFISHKKHEHNDGSILEYNLNECRPFMESELKFNLLVPEQDVMQYFIQWQSKKEINEIEKLNKTDRLRETDQAANIIDASETNFTAFHGPIALVRGPCSSLLGEQSSVEQCLGLETQITTTPSLFGIGDIKYEDKSADVHIVAKFPWGQQTVEIVSINSSNNNLNKTSYLSCLMTIEKALFLLLSDGLTNTTKEEYLRLHRKMAPYKFSFALEEASNKQSLVDLAALLYHRLELKRISSWLPNFSSSTESQIKENLQLGIGYTVILSEGTLANGIFHLMNSSTMLREQVHVADFDSYAALICAK